MYYAVTEWHAKHVHFDRRIRGELHRGHTCIVELHPSKNHVNIYLRVVLMSSRLTLTQTDFLCACACVHVYAIP